MGSVLSQYGSSGSTLYLLSEYCSVLLCSHCHVKEYDVPFLLPRRVTPEWGPEEAVLHPVYQVHEHCYVPRLPGLKLPSG